VGQKSLLAGYSGDGAVKLNAREIAAYKPPAGKDHIVFDSELAGFGLRYRNGRKTWIYQYAFGSGEGRVNARMTLGEYPALSPTKARDTAEDLYARVRLGQHPAAEKRASRDEHRNTFGRLVSGYLVFQKNEIRPSTYVVVELYLNRYARPLHGLPASAVDRKKIAELLETIAKNSGAVSANRARSALSALFSWAMRRGLHDSNPVVGTEKRKERSRHRVLSDVELTAIWNALGTNDYDDILRLLLLTGQRAGEIGGLRWSEINFNEGLISLPAERTKNGHPHSFPMSRPVIGLLRTRPQTKREFVFGRGRGGFSGWNGGTKRKLDEHITGGAGFPLPHWTIHDLRRTFATGLQRLGVRLEVTEAILNHVGGSRAGVTGIYQRHDWATEKRAALDAWAAHVLSVVSGKKDKSNVTTIRGPAR
jgi:integrase